MKKFYYNKEDMLGDVKKEQKEALKDLKNYNETYKKTKKHNIVQVSVITITCIFLFKVLVGTIEITAPVSYSKNRLYKIRINDSPITFEVLDKHKIPIVPFFINLNTYHKDTYFGIKAGSLDNYPESSKGKYILKIESYACYSKNKERQVGCQTDNNFHEVKTNDITCKKIYIRRNGRPEKVKYDGKFINDITPYLQEKGLYYIRVDVEYKNVKSKIEFFVEQTKKEQLIIK